MLTLNDGRSELWQWDTGRTLAVDADCSQVHFSNKVFGRSIDVDVIDGAAIIPDILLQTDKDLNVWAFVGTAENGYTKISKTFKVNRRNKPADYVFTPTEQTTLAELVGRLDKIEESQDPDAIKNAVDDYLKQNPVEVPVQSVNGKTGTVELTAEDVGAISVETDPTVPGWAKQPEKPTYTAAEVGALPDTYTPPVDSTLTQSGQAADAKAVGDRLSALSEEKVSLPKDDTGAVQNGTAGQILQTNGDGTTQWVDKPEGGGGTSSETADIPVTAEKAFAASVLELNHVADNQYVAQHDSVLFEATEDTTLSVGNDNLIGAPYSENVGSLTMATVAYTEIENGYALDYTDDYTGTKNFQNQRFGFAVNIKSGKTYTLRFYVNAASVENVYLYLTNDKKLTGTLMGGGNIRNGTVCQITFVANADYAFARISIVNLPAEITKITLCEGDAPLEYGAGSESYALLAGEKVWLSGVRNLNCVGVGKFYESPLALTSLNGIPTQNGAINSCATNKVWVNMGDSIWTFGASTGGIGTITDYMLALCGGTWHNIATGGTTMASRPGSYAGTYDALDFWKIADAIVEGNYTDAKAAAAELTSNFANIDNVNWSVVDYVTVAYGTNDLAFGAEIDNASNLFDTATICGALRYGIKAINSAYPNIRFKVLGVVYRSSDAVTPAEIVECNEALRAAAAYVGAEFIDGYGINAGNSGTFLYDGTHPNANGKVRIAETLARNIHDIWYA